MSGYVFDQHVAEQPDVVATLLDQDGIPALDLNRPIVFSGIGTSLHACRIAATWLRLLSQGQVRPAALDAHDVALRESLRPEDQVVVVSHRGTKRYPNAVLAAARKAGARTITVTGQGSTEPDADVVIRTCPQERASTHTISYTSALVVLARIVAASLSGSGASCGEELSTALRQIPQAMRDTLALPLPKIAVDAVVRGLPTIVTGTGLDAITAAEAALKIKEGTYRWAEGMHTEFALHGTPAVFSAEVSAFVLVAEADDGGRSDDLCTLLRTLSAPVLTVSTSPTADLGFAETHPLLRPLVSVLPFQRLVSAAAAELGANPDLTHVETEPWGSAIKAVPL
ncbi:glucosamine--fructose-6-phosphate aminotransferase (isomerizing) [Micromonospora matsumotoense]|uniref:Glutamine--fructose-6-phosphate aminotransferase [isomerizing] n=1 Tax=Micromonospora matsumotoense TaxID=121616 RepID=A0A1C4YUI4_9ACTN|nr:SIS domain-containing protein [Micromonospora matsumotoense]SCF24405.1 glucosamine--fructose-6-phosphate aminotransferase (isomerizing) [Micromonospora matsumotoense]